MPGQCHPPGPGLFPFSQEQSNFSSLTVGLLARLAIW